MLHALMAPVVAWMTAVMTAAGPWGVLLLMAIESACIPLPSEVIMPFAGYLAFKDGLAFHGLGAGSPVAQIWIAGFAGALGCNLGSLPAYELGRWGGHAAVRRFGRYIWLHEGHLDRAHRFFERFGPEAILIGRMLPVVRTFIALPAGIAEMDRTRFHLYTFLGSLPWCLGLAFVGYKLGQKWDTLGPWFHRFDLVILALVVAGLAWFVRDHLKHRAR
ncbi:MAG TPA: DedA family protein [Holophagaceae bacterium]|nr:DedA family protein [Holophagaceae bacterium]